MSSCRGPLSAPLPSIIPLLSLNGNKVYLYSDFSKKLWPYFEDVVCMLTTLTVFLFGKSFTISYSNPMAPKSVTSPPSSSYIAMNPDSNIELAFWFSFSTTLIFKVLPSNLLKFRICQMWLEQLLAVGKIYYTRINPVGLVLQSKEYSVFYGHIVDFPVILGKNGDKLE